MKEERDRASGSNQLQKAKATQADQSNSPLRAKEQIRQGRNRPTHFERSPDLRMVPLPSISRPSH